MGADEREMRACITMHLPACCQHQRRALISLVVHIGDMPNDYSGCNWQDAAAGLRADHPFQWLVSHSQECTVVTVTFWKRRAVEPAAEPTETVSPLAHLYSVLADVQRDQVASQMEQASTNDLKSVGIIGAALAIVVALLLLRATDPKDIAYWWWYPLPLFIVPSALAAMPLRRPSSKRTFLGGPSVPQLLARFEAGKSTQPGEMPYTLEEMFAMLLVDLHTAWRNNDTILVEEQRSFYRGAAALGIATLMTIGLYAWGLS